MLTHPDINKTFHIYTDASDIQLGASITQDDKPPEAAGSFLSPHKCHTHLSINITALYRVFN
jgi:hypothetical protein